MPLKHLTETVLVVLLGAMVVLTGIVLDTLPLLPAGALPWAIAFGIALLYAFIVYPTLKRNRAEYSFRLLHFLPAAMLVLWLIIQLISLYEPGALAVHYWYTWGWSLFAVVVGFLLLVAFCLTVIRRRFPRIALLALILLPFTALAFTSEQFLHWDDKLSAVVWQGNWWDLVGTGSFIASRPMPIPGNESDPNLAPSDNPAEEAWRRRLRALDERRRQILEERRGGSSSSISSATVIAATSSAQASSVSSVVIAMNPSSAAVSSSAQSVLAVLSSQGTFSSAPSSVAASSVQSSAQSSALIGQVTPPPNLPSSGFGLGSVVVMMLAGYTGIVHDRARRRLL